MDFGDVLWFVESLKEGVCPGLRANCACGARKGVPGARNSMGDDDGLFIPGPAVVKIIENSRPICRRFDFCLMRVRVLLPQPQMAEDAFHDVGFMNEADDFHLMCTAGTTERVHFPDTRLRGHKPS